MLLGGKGPDDSPYIHFELSSWYLFSGALYRYFTCELTLKCSPKTLMLGLELVCSFCSLSLRNIRVDFIISSLPLVMMMCLRWNHKELKIMISPCNVARRLWTAATYIWNHHEQPMNNVDNMAVNRDNSLLLKILRSLLM